jgi:hypothetical protein
MQSRSKALALRLKGDVDERFCGWIDRPEFGVHPGANMSIKDLLDNWASIGTLGNFDPIAACSLCLNMYDVRHSLPSPDV